MVKSFKVRLRNTLNGAIPGVVFHDVRKHEINPNRQEINIPIVVKVHRLHGSILPIVDCEVRFADLRFLIQNAANVVVVI